MSQLRADTPLPVLRKQKYEFHIVALSLAGVQLQIVLCLHSFGTENGNKGSTAAVASYRTIVLNALSQDSILKRNLIYYLKMGRLMRYVSLTPGHSAEVHVRADFGS